MPENHPADFVRRSHIGAALAARPAGAVALARRVLIALTGVDTVSFIINPISRFGYVGDGRKAMLTLKDKVFDALMLRRTKARIGWPLLSEIGSALVLSAALH
jgi:hypothetical protein